MLGFKWISILVTIWSVIINPVTNTISLFTMLKETSIKLYSALLVMVILAVCMVKPMCYKHIIFSHYNK